MRGFSIKKKKTVKGERLCRCLHHEWSCQNARWELEILLLPTSWCHHHARAARLISQTHATPTRPHPPCNTHLAVTLLLALICFSLHTQVFNLSFKISKLVLVVFVFLLMRNLCLCYFFWLFGSVTLWLSYWWVCVCLCELWLCATILYR